MTDKMKILVVDDKKITGDNFGFMLGSGGHKITVVDDAREALALIQTKDFDVIFMDIIMPDIDGVEALGKIRQIKPGLPVIMMTGYSVEEKREKTKELGALACLDKPLELNNIRSIVQEALGKSI